MIFSGISIGTLFTLFVVPAVYMVLAADHHLHGAPVHAREGQKRE